MKGLRTILCFLGILTISFFFPVSVQAAPVGKFTFLSGRVDITSPGQAARPVHLNDDVAVGDIVRAKSRSRAEITFIDGNILRLAQNTRVEITEYMVGQEETRGSLHLYRGKIQSVVKTVLGRIFGREKRNRYEVRTPTAVCGVRGTNFFTWHTKAGSGAAFKEGQGYAYSAGRPEDMRYLSAGQAMLVVSPFEPPLIRPATPFELEQHFDDTRPEKSAKADEPRPVMEETPVPVDTDEAKRLIREPDPAGDAKTSLQKTEEETGRTDAETSVSEDEKLKKTAEALSQSAPEPVAPEEPPPADAIPFTGTFSLTGLDDGTLSGYIEKTASYPEDDQGSGKVKIRGVYSDPVPGAKTGPLEGTTDDGSAFQGYLGTVISSCRGDFSSLYVHEGGGAGYLYGDFSGSLASETLSASGEAHRSSTLGQVAFQAGDGETLSEALGRNLVRDEDTHLYDTCGDYYRLPVLGSINAGGGFDSEQLDPTVRVAELTLENPSTGATGPKIGVFAVSTSGGRYSNQLGSREWFALYGEKGPGSPYYILGAIHGTDDLQGHVDLEASQPLTYMDTAYLGSLSLWYRGMYNMPEQSQSIENLPYQSAGVGLFDLNPLAFAGHWGMGTAPCSEGSLYYNDGGTMGLAGNDRGLMGGLTSPWNHDAAPLFAMGEYSDSGPGGTYLWNTPVEGWDPEEPNRAFVGFSAGFWKNNLQEDGSANYGTMRGAVLSIYRDSGGSAGYLIDPDLSGLFYPDLGMWSVSGAWDRQGKGAVPSLADFDTQQMSGNLAGRFENQGSLLGCGTGETLFLTSAGGYTTPWGLYNLKLGEGNTFSGKPETDAAWSAVAGGSAAFDPDNTGYWLAHVGGTWTAAGEITGDIAGTYLTDSHLGNIKGPFWGINTVLDEGDGGSSGTWIGQSIGTFEGEPLSFSSDFTTDDEAQPLKTYRLVCGTAEAAEFKRWHEDGTDDYDYEFFTSTDNDEVLRFGRFWKEEYDSGSKEGEIWLPDGMKLEFKADTPSVPFRRIKLGDWPVGGNEDDFFISKIKDPGGDTTWVQTSSEKRETNALAESGVITGMMGGTGDLWHSGESNSCPISLMGTYSPDGGDYDQPSLFGVDIRQSDLTPGGTFRGYLGGVLDEMEGKIYTLYIEDKNLGGHYPAGILKGSFSGVVYPSIGMWNASGSLHAIEMDHIQGISPADLESSLEEGFIAGWLSGGFGSGEAFIRSGLGWGRTLSLRGDGRWGVYQLLYGYDNGFSNPDGATTWNARTGGWAEFGSHPVSGEGTIPDIGMWLSSPMKDPVLEDGLLSGHFDGEFLSYTRYGELHGDVLGNCDTENGTWQAGAAGYWNATHTLKFNGFLDGELVGMVRKKCCTYLKETGWASGLMGGLSDLWSASRGSPAETRFMGDYEEWLAGGAPPVFSMGIRSYNPYDDTVTLWNQDDNTQNGAYYGFLAGRGMEEEEGEGTMLALYLDKWGNAGILKGALDLEAYADLEMWEGQGTLFPMPVWDDTGYQAAELHPENLLCTESTEGIMNGPGAFTENSDNGTAHFGDIAWTRYRKDEAALWKPDPSPSVFGVTSLLYGGTFDYGEMKCDDGPLEASGWFSEFSFEDDHEKSRGVLLSAPDAPGSWSGEMISGTGYETWVNWDAAVTGVSGAELKGTFDPDSYTCQAATLWAFMDTSTFMNLADTKVGQDKLAELNIPCIEVGRASLTGEDCFLNVTMKDVTFFAYSTGHDPRIWATSDVGGDYFKKPQINHTVTLNGGGLSADFQVRKWESNRWGASINNGVGTLTREDVSGSVNLNFSGAAAGSYTGNSTGTFSGTASGIAAPAPPAIEKID